MRNQPRASAAQTASVGHRDMMTFLPAAGSSGGAPAADAKAPASQDMSTAASQGMSMTAAAAMGSACAPSDNNTAGNLSLNIPTPLPNSTVPDPLLRAALDRGESMDDDAFNASLDALLGDPEAIPAGGTLFGTLDSAFPPSPNSAFPGNNNKPQDVVAGRKRKAPPGRLVSEMSSLTNASGDPSGGSGHANPTQGQHIAQGGQAPVPAQGQPRPLNYAARGMVQLPPAFTSKPISVAAGSAGGLGENPNLLGTELFAGGNQVQPQSNPPAQAQQSPFQVASVAAPQPQHLQGQGNSLMSQMGLQTQAQQQQQQQINLGLTWDASMGFPTPSLQAATAGSPVPQAAVSSALPRVASAPVAVGSAANPPTKPGYRPSTGKRKRRASATAGTLPVSEDEGERQKRRSERNMREQERSHRIADRIAELRNVLSEAGVHFKPDRHSTLVSVANYIKMLQGRSKSLDEEHRRLLDTISGADRLANEASSNGGIALGGALPGGTTTTVQTHRSLPASSTSSAAGQSTDEEFRVFVQGIDYKSIFSGCGAALAVANVDGRFVDCNDEFLRISEYTRSELLGDENVPRHGAWRQGPTPPVIGVGGPQQPGQAVAVSTSSVANSSMAVKSPDFHRSGSGSPNQHEQRDKDLPTEVRVRKPHRLSLFNLLGGEDMEAVYAAMSDMLRAPAPSASSRQAISSEEGDGGGTSSSSSDSCVKSDLTRSMEGDSGSSGNEVSGSGSSGAEPIAAGPGADSSRYTVDHWTGRVKHTRRKNRTLQLNISLVRTADGRPKFFNCAISEVE
ncbi:hypothetical protein ACHAXT_011213 [Thalassiosira profunda]